MDRNQIEGICEEKFDFSKYADYTIANVYEKINKANLLEKIDITTYYKEIKVKNKRRYILCFNPQLFVDQRKAREQHVQALKSDIFPTLNAELLDAKKSRTLEATENKFKKAIKMLELSSFVKVKLSEVIIEKEGSRIKTYQGVIDILESEKKKLLNSTDFGC